MAYKNSIKSFYEITWHEFQDRYRIRLKDEIFAQTKEYLLGVDENQYIEHLIDKYTLEPLKVFDETEDISTPKIEKELVGGISGRRFEQQVYVFTLKYKFQGSPELFKILPNPCTIVSQEIFIDYRNSDISDVSFEIRLTKKDPNEFNRRKTDCYKNAFTNITNVNKNAAEWNSRLSQLVTDYFSIRKKHFLDENDFFSAINVRVNQNTTSIFSAPTIKKKIIPRPSIPDNREFVSEPTMSNEMYLDVLKVIYDAGKSMEKKPALYLNKDEEGIRDQFLFILETRYEGTTATGETFNKSGKTDILLKYAEDGSNLFIGECKFWKGASEYHKAIDQLFERYLTWSDSKVAVILFVKNKDFSAVLGTIKQETQKHKYFKSYIGDRRETSFSYQFFLPQDKDKLVYLEVLSFHYDK
ncbi:MAG: hypothetical protein MUP85_24330 [Candidatus Lokiarchaeota archaeon]|nr:hypothetical protein [Candidatus Lokiarchaeota archaeon]